MCSESWFWKGFWQPFLDLINSKRCTNAWNFWNYQNYKRLPNHVYKMRFAGLKSCLKIVELSSKTSCESKVASICLQLFVVNHICFKFNRSWECRIRYQMDVLYKLNLSSPKKVHFWSASRIFGWKVVWNLIKRFKNRI